MSETENEKEIINKVAERLSFFFSNANLRVDRFLRPRVLDTKTKGYVTIDVLLKFNTIKSITEDRNLIAKAVKEVSNPKLQLNDDESAPAIARVEPFSEAYMEDYVKYTLRVSNIPTKELENGDAEYDISRDELSAMFQEYGDVAMVRLLKSKIKGSESENKVAVGRAFVEFHSLDGMKKAVDELCTENIEDESLKPKKILSIKGTEIRVKTMQQWLDKVEKKRGAKGQRDSSSPKKRKNENNEEQIKIDEIKYELDWKPGCVISCKGLPDDCDREAILTAVRGFMGEEVTAFADYSRGQKDGVIRFDEPSDKIASLAADVNEGKVTVNGVKVESASVLEGDDEKKYYNEYIAFRTERMRKNAQEKLDRKKKRRGGRQ